MFTKLNMKGVSHHFLLPIMAVLVIAGIGGYVMQRSSSANTYSGSCVKRTFSVGSKSECVRDIQKIYGITADAVYGNQTKNAVGTSTIKANSATWKKICDKGYKKYLARKATATAGYRHACLGQAQSTKSTQYKATGYFVRNYTYPSYPETGKSVKYYASKSQVAAWEKQGTKNRKTYNRSVAAYNLSKSYQARLTSVHDNVATRAVTDFKAACAKIPGKVTTHKVSGKTYTVCKATAV